MGVPESTPAAALLHRDAYLTDLGRGHPSSVFTRGNGPLFYSLTVASLLETTAAGSANRLALMFWDDAEFRDWVRSDWHPRRLLRQQTLREYIVTTWPEFDWTAARDRFQEAHDPHHRSHRLLSPGEEALRRCAATAQSALFYRCLARWANEVPLREVATRLAQEDSGGFQKFRAIYERAERETRLGNRRSWRAAVACVQEARDVHVQTAFNALVQQWGPNTPFPALDYRQFIARMKDVIEQHARPGWRERLVFRAWTKVPEPPKATAAPRTPGWFKPVVPIEARAQSLTSRSRWRP